MATLSSQINNMTPAQKIKLANKIKPLAGTIAAIVSQKTPAIAPMVNMFLSTAVSNPGALGVALTPVEGMLPSQAKSLVQGAITQTLGAASKGGTTATTKGGAVRTKTTTAPRPVPGQPGVFNEEPAGMPGWLKAVGIFGGVGLGLWVVTRRRETSLKKGTNT